jgi:hypothetical protein
VWAASRRGESARVARLSGALDALEGGLIQLPGTVAAAYGAGLARAREALGEAAFAEAREAGRARPLEETVAEALALAVEQVGPGAA